MLAKLAGHRGLFLDCRGGRRHALADILDSAFSLRQTCIHPHSADASRNEGEIVGGKSVTPCALFGSTVGEYVAHDSNLQFEV